jgi:hypothetical protein
MKGEKITGQPAELNGFGGFKYYLPLRQKWKKAGIDINQCTCEKCKRKCPDAYRLYNINGKCVEDNPSWRKWIENEIELERCTCHECYKAGYCPYVYDLQNIDSNCISRRNEGEF